MAKYTSKNPTLIVFILRYIGFFILLFFAGAACLYITKKGLNLWYGVSVIAGVFIYSGYHWAIRKENPSQSIALQAKFISIDNSHYFYVDKTKVPFELVEEVIHLGEMETIESNHIFGLYNSLFDLLFSHKCDVFAINLNKKYRTLGEQIIYLVDKDEDSIPDDYLANLIMRQATEAKIRINQKPSTN